MIDVKFSHFNNGACPMCKHNTNCNILKSMNHSVNLVASAKFDKVMEIVVYRCPEFEEKDFIADKE